MARAEMTVHLKDLAEFKELAARAEKAEAAIERARDVCDAVAYKMPSDPDSYGPYPEGRCDLAGEVLAALDEGDADA